MASCTFLRVLLGNEWSFCYMTPGGAIKEPNSAVLDFTDSTALSEVLGFLCACETCFRLKLVLICGIMGLF